MIRIQRILVPIDFSEHSQYALQYAAEIAQQLGAKLTLLHIVEPIAYPADWGFSQVGLVDLEKELIDTATSELEKITQELRAKGIQVDFEVHSGARASDEIVQFAKEHNVDIISIGTHGRSGLEHFLFGSTTERVLRKAPCPVLAVRLPEYLNKENAGESD